MLKEFTHIRQEKAGFRRLFANDKYDLYLWYNERGGDLNGFQLVYFSPDMEQKAFTWMKSSGYSHDTVDGWDSNRFNRSPVLQADGAFDKGFMAREMEAELGGVEAEIKKTVLSKIAEFPGPPAHAD